MTVDDSRLVRSIITASLGEHGYQTQEAENGEEALAILEKESVDLILLDVMMPKMDGLELCRHIRASDFGRYIYIILLTARDAKNDLIHGLEAGAG